MRNRNDSNEKYEDDNDTKESREGGMRQCELEKKIRENRKISSEINVRTIKLWSIGYFVLKYAEKRDRTSKAWEKFDK